ncbi:MAG TPA: hypothetical protein VHB47_04080 [Thermoanaerobaculia bacterium]|jgi:hypothetical protein|nr:hypothetical protein [Thermoanaerobaculia bacterium]
MSQREQRFYCNRVVLFALTLCMATPLAAESVLRMSATALLPPGTRVKGEVKAEFQIHSLHPVPKGQASGEVAAEISYRLPATKTFIWQFEVPANGRVPESLFDFEFPADLRTVPKGSIGAMMFPIHLWIQGPATPAGKPKTFQKDYTFGMHYPSAGAGGQLIQRCLRVTGDVENPIVETGPDCKDETFLRIRQHSRHLPQNATPP